MNFHPNIKQYPTCYLTYELEYASPKTPNYYLKCALENSFFLNVFM